MITIRFATGLSAQYNDATHIKWYPNGTIGLFRGSPDDGHTIAYVHNGTECVIEFRQPCKVRHDGINLTEERALEMVLEKLQNYQNGHSSQLVELKKRLREFDSRTHLWLSEK